MNRHRHIAIEGPIGVGKTTLTRLLAERLGCEPVLEKPEDNPFLERFYDDLAGYAFQAQLFFLFQRVKQLQPVNQPGIFTQGVVSDFMFAKDAIFARLNLSDDEYPLYLQMYQQVAQQLPEPDVIIWLQARPATLLGRVHQRGIAMEQRMETSYLDRLSTAYVDFFRSYAGAPVLAVDTEQVDPNREPGFSQVIEALSHLGERKGVYELGSDATLKPMFG